MTSAPTEFSRVFIDAEFTDTIDMHLISLACVAEDGAEFYAEVDDFPDGACNEFVRSTVLPLLGHVSGATMSRAQLGTQIMKWLTEVRCSRELVVISYDYFGDWTLLVEALGCTPAWLRPDNIRDRVDESVRNRFFEISQMPRHHALWDARALRSAYRAARV
jgi:hypothetical protein